MRICVLHVCIFMRMLVKLVHSYGIVCEHCVYLCEFKHVTDLKHVADVKHIADFKRMHAILHAYFEIHIHVNNNSCHTIHGPGPGRGGVWWGGPPPGARARAHVWDGMSCC